MELNFRFPAGERRLCAKSMDCNGSKAPVRSDAGNGCNPSEAVGQSASGKDNCWPIPDLMLPYLGHPLVLIVETLLQLDINR